MEQFLALTIQFLLITLLSTSSGQEFPTTSLYTTAQESINVTEDIFQSGLAFDETASDYTIDLNGLATTGANDKMELKMISGKQASTSMSAGLDDIVRSQKTLTACILMCSIPPITPSLKLMEMKSLPPTLLYR